MLTNFDGDPIEFSVHCYSYPKKRQSWIRKALEGISEVQAAGPNSFVYLDENDALIGSVELTEGGLEIQTNSASRAEEVCLEVETACGDLLTYVGEREVMDEGPHTGMNPDEVRTILKNPEVLAQLEQRMPGVDFRTFLEAQLDD